MSETPAHGGRLTIDLGALCDNWRALKARAGDGECAAVVKADGYGIGTDHAAHALAKAGCRTFFVALPEEGERARRAAPDADIYVLNGFLGNRDHYRRHRLKPVIGSLAELEEVATSLKDGAGAALHVDTGMNRLGLSVDEALSIGPDDPRLVAAGVDLLMSHLACADTPAHPLNRIQCELFSSVKARFGGLRASLANSAGTLAGGPFRHDLARPGIALYGGRAIEGITNPMKPVVRLDLMILATRTIKRGDPIGYGARESMTRDGRIAIVCAGYADGLLRAGGSSDERKGAIATIAGHDAPLIGRISMDLIALDVTDVPAELATRREFATLIGERYGLDDYADAAGTIGYEVLTGLGRRYERCLIDA